jgi:hypothetical protein
VAQNIAARERWSDRRRLVDDRHYWLYNDVEMSDYLTDRQLRILCTADLSVIDDSVIDVSVVQSRYLYRCVIKHVDFEEPPFTSMFRVVFSRTAMLISRLAFVEILFVRALQFFSETNRDRGNVDEPYDEDVALLREFMPDDAWRSIARLNVANRIIDLAVALRRLLRSHLCWLETEVDRLSREDDERSPSPELECRAGRHRFSHSFTSMSSDRDRSPNTSWRESSHLDWLKLSFD